MLMRSNGSSHNVTILPVVLSGGSGTRLWPLSRAMYPKQFIKRLGPNETSLLGSTLKRLGSKNEFAAPIILSNNDHRFLVEQEAREAGISDVTIVLEPVQRNTAPAIAVAAVIAANKYPNAAIAVMPSDHVILNDAAFAAAVQVAAKLAVTGRHVLFGIKPTSPHTGYGYIRHGRI